MDRRTAIHLALRLLALRLLKRRLQYLFFRDSYVGTLRCHYFIAHNAVVRLVIFIFIFHLSLLDVYFLYDLWPFCLFTWLTVCPFVFHSFSPFTAVCSGTCGIPLPAAPVIAAPLQAAPLVSPAPPALPAFSQITVDAATGIGVVVVAPTSGPLVHRALISLHLPRS